MGAFDGLSVLVRAFDGPEGCSEICVYEGGLRVIRICLGQVEYQRELLSAGWPGIPLRVEEQVLELLPPWREGEPFAVWLSARPDLAHRRDACLSILGQCLSDRVPACILTPAVCVENLIFTGEGAGLQYLPDCSRWAYGASEDEAVAALAQVFRRLLTQGLTRWEAQHFPPELCLFCSRIEGAGYCRFWQLQRDLSVIPGGFRQPSEAIRECIRRWKAWFCRLMRPAARMLAVVLAVAALLSLISAYRLHLQDHRNRWPGISPIGGQTLN